MGIDLPFAGFLAARRRDLLLVGETGGIGAVHLGTRKRTDSKLHHHDVNADDDAEERHKHCENHAAGQNSRLT